MSHRATLYFAICLAAIHLPVFSSAAPAAIAPRFRDGVINARGNRPNLERKPRLKRIADPANLQPTITPAALEPRGKAKKTAK